MSIHLGGRLFVTVRPVAIGTALLIQGCSVWHTDSSLTPEKARDGTITEVDKTRTRDGLPYFLPKGMVRLIIKPGDAPATPAVVAVQKPPAEDAPDTKKVDKTATLDFANFGVAAVKPEENGAPAAASDPAKEKEKPPKITSYSVSVEAKMVADTEGGALYAHYSPNWLFEDNTSISTSKGGLLNTVASTVEDRSPQIISNLAETAVQVGKFMAAAGGGVPLGLSFGGLEGVPDLSTQMNLVPGAANNKKIKSAAEKLIELGKEAADQVDKLSKAYPIAPPPAPHIKQLNVNEYFDPLDAAQRTHVENLFADDTTGAGAYSPLKLNFSKIGTAHGRHIDKAHPRSNGLWFREPLEIEINVVFNGALKSKIIDALDALKKVAPKMRKDGQALVALESDVPVILTQLTDGLAAMPDELKADAEEAIKRLKRAQHQLPSVREDFDATKTAFDQQADALKASYAGSHPGETAGLGRFTVTVPNKERAFSLNVPRSAFVKRTMTVQIDSGMLTGFGHVRPSEIEGFSGIPLDLAKKLAGLPKALWESRGEAIQSQNTSISNETTLLGSQKSLEQARLDLEKARFENEKARVDLERQKIEAAKAATKTPTP